MISVSRTNLPTLKNYNKYLRKIWKSNWLTNNGKLVQKLEKRLEKYWGVKNVVCVDHGTSAILISLKALNIEKEIYVSPMNFIATVSAPVWLGIKPKFVDLDEAYRSPAIVTHLYGDPNLCYAEPVIYDASHAFATKCGGKYIVNYGDISVISFNAVKIFQTIEGGAVVTNNNELAEKARWLRNFGFKDRYSFQGTGINCKMNEFEAAMGLCALPLVGKMVKRYQKIVHKYNVNLGYLHEQVTYYPIWYRNEKKLLKAIPEFEKHGIYPRRYFYPPLNKVFGGKSCPIAEDFMSRVLCLPLYYELTDKQQDLVIRIAQKTL